MNDFQTQLGIAAGRKIDELTTIINEVTTERDSLLTICKEFVRRVERGEIRSKNTYLKMKLAIKEIEEK